VFKKKNKGKLRMTELFSNEFFQLSLEDLEWEHAESTNGHAWQTIAFKTIEEESQFFAMMLRLLNKPIKLGEFVYSLSGSNRLRRDGPSIKRKAEHNRFFTVSQIFKREPKPQPEPGKGVVFEPEPVKVFD